MTIQASISLDLDNKWTYLKIHGDPNWESFPSYLDLVLARTLDIFESLGLKVTFFVVGQDAELDVSGALKQISARGHDLGNHSFKHEPWLHRYTLAELEEEIGRAHRAILSATGEAPIGFRGPGFSLTRNTLSVLGKMNYCFDASTFPSFLGPLARAYYFSRSKLDSELLSVRDSLFGSWSDGLRPLRPYRISGRNAVDIFGGQDWLLEIPVTTVPIVRVPFHLSYFLYLASFSETLAKAFFRSSLRVCRLRRVEPSLLLHPLDFIGGDDDGDLGFFPAMNLAGKQKIELVTWALGAFRNAFDVKSLTDYALCKLGEGNLPQYALLDELPE